MLNLPQKTLNLIKQKLTRKQKEVEEELQSVEKDDPVRSDSLAESSEPGTESWLAEAHTKTLALGGELKKMAMDIRTSLLKIRKGTYGHCERCDKHIETGRLLAMPTAKLCLVCAT